MERGAIRKYVFALEAQNRMTMSRPRSIALIAFCFLPLWSFAQAADTADPPQNQQPTASPQNQEPPVQTEDQKQKTPPPAPAPPPAGSRNQQTPPGDLPNAPSSSKTEPSLEDLGFPASQAQGDAKLQALLDKRTHMLKIHQRLGLIAAIPITAAVVTSVGAGGKDTSKTSRDLHAALGGLGGDLYFISAYYAIRAPRVPGTQTRGPIRFHKAMAWIHGPGMIATPILGIMAFDQKSKGEKVHGIASAHGPVAIVTAGAFGAALLSVSVKF